MKVRGPIWLAGLLCVSQLGACTDQQSFAHFLGEREKPKPRRGPERTLFLHESFQLADATCQVSGVKSALVESAALPYPKARVRPDVRALEVALHCTDARGQPIEGRSVLPEDSVVLLAFGGDKTLAPRPETAAHSRLVFDLPDEFEPQVPAARRFDASSGQSVVAREHAIGRLLLRTRTLSLAVSLRQRYADAALDTLVDRLAESLANGSGLGSLARDAEAESALTQLATIYGDVRRRFQPARLELTQLAAKRAETRNITLSLTRPKNHESAFEVARFALTLGQTPEGALRVASFDNREAARNALACDALRDDLAKSLRERQVPTKRGPTHFAASKGQQSCNALGLLLPTACNEVDPGLLARALEVGARCGAPFSKRKTSKQKLPGDFQITLRRGRPTSGFDKSPRYVVSLFHGGQVVFHGKHWVESQERSDGRTDLGLLAGLHEKIRELDFFARRGGHYDQDHCSPTDDQGDVMTVIAGDKQRMVLNREGCRGPFSESELVELRRQVELVSGLSAWTQKGVSIGDQDAEQWAIAE